jgi:hypothetical protein
VAASAAPVTVVRCSTRVLFNILPESDGTSAGDHRIDKCGEMVRFPAQHRVRGAYTIHGDVHGVRMSS